MKKIKRLFPFALIACFTLNALPLGGCGAESSGNVLRVASWDEYICEGGEDSYVGADALPLYEEFEIWYEATYGKEITVEYIPLQDNETMYNKIKMGDSYDILCPSEYMCMKLAEEGYLQKLPDAFFDKANENNYYANYVSSYIDGVFHDEAMKLSGGETLAEYVAGYMWGSTGFVFNPETVAREDVKSWKVFLNEKYDRRITAKDNVRDSYFVGLGMYYEELLLGEKAKNEAGTLSKTDYKHTLFTKMNDTSSMSSVGKLLEKMRGNLYGLETDEGKLDVITGRFDISYQWSGDAVYVLDSGEDDEITDTPVYLEYCIPDAASNLFFDGWVMMKDANEKAATAFINYLSMPENAVRNMDYIGYTSCIASETVFDYISEKYGAGDEEESEDYDLSYFFGENHVLQAPLSQTQYNRQLFAQYPTMDVIDRLVVMTYFNKEANEKANRMWNNIK